MIMKKYLSFVFAAAMVCGMSGCQQNPVEPQPKDDPTPVPTAFAKKHLLEEFTGQDCGYCPMGMDSVVAFVGDDPNWVVVLHHYGYQKDHFSVAGSQKITNKLNVSGAPNVSIDRKATKTADGKATCFHPAYLPSLNRSQFDDSTYVGLTVTNTYDAGTRQLHVHVHGIVVNEDYPELKLTLLIKESGMIDYQQDYYGSYEGWEEFRHANAVRAFLSTPLGDILTVERALSDQPEPLTFNEEYELQLDAEWVPDNCMVVAIVADDFMPVVQVEQTPVVEGTKGGADIRHGGVTPVPVPDYYPEPSDDMSPNMFTLGQPIEINEAYTDSRSYPDEGYRIWQVQAYNTSATYNISGTTCIPFVNMHLFTAPDATAIPIGSYEFNSTNAPGTAAAGYRDDAHFDIGGSMMYFTSLSYLQQGYLVPAAQWLIADGTLTVTEQGWSVTGHALNGTDILLTGSTPIQKVGQNAPAKIRKPIATTEAILRR